MIHSQFLIQTAIFIEKRDALSRSPINHNNMYSKRDLSSWVGQDTVQTNLETLIGKKKDRTHPHNARP